ncbi:hypothetical protein ABZU25_08610 [Micromonospora sp. NPDC005215]|uniref:hypothetical protein n=1 Tax=Micromonospora sp. NPDC005215 TaxID=3157024 RepID=UPI0033B8CFCB
MGDSENSVPDDRPATFVGRTLALGAASIAVLLVVALTGDEGTATAAVAAVGVILTALAGLAASHTRPDDRR